MNNFLQDIYVYLWGVLALLMFIIAVKYIRRAETRRVGVYAIVVGAVFVFLSIWYGLRTFGGYQMFDGTFGIIFRIVLGLWLVFVIGFGIYSRKRSRDNKED